MKAKRVIRLQIIKPAFWCQRDQSPSHLQPAKGRTAGNAARQQRGWSQPSPKTASLPKHPLPKRPTLNTGSGPGGRRSAGISHHGEGAMFAWEYQRSHKSRAASYLQPRYHEERNSPQHTTNDCGANGRHGEAVSSRGTDVGVLSSSQGSNTTSRARGNECKMDRLKRRLAEVRDRTIILIRYFNHRCITPKFSAGMSTVKFNITAKGRYHLLHKNKN